jgi:hypothetical protein
VPPLLKIIFFSNERRFLFISSPLFLICIIGQNW